MAHRVSAGGPSIPPLEVTGKPGGSDLMGLEWTARTSLISEKVREVKAEAGLYLLTDAESHELRVHRPISKCCQTLARSQPEKVG